MIRYKRPPEKMFPPAWHVLIEGLDALSVL